MQALLLFRAVFDSSESLPAVDQHDLSHPRTPDPSLVLVPWQRGVEGVDKGKLLAGLSGKDRQASLSWGHDCQGLHLPSPTGGLLEVDLQDVVQFWAVQDIGNVEHQH